MYERYFGLNEKPFSITPDPRYLYLTARHAEALAHLLYGVTESGGFVQLTGEVGTGKTTLVRSLLEKIPGHVEVALILNPRLSPNEFLHTICDELGAQIPDQASPKEMVDALNKSLLEAHARGSRVVLIVDEAQNLSAEVLEQVRLLTNLETAKQKLLQIILIGQTELRELLARNDLRQLAQRITGRYHLDPLHKDETFAYVRHRLKVAGCTSEVMRPSALTELHRISGGIPRSINVISDRAMLGAYTREQRVVKGGLVREAASEVFGRKVRHRWTPLFYGALMTTTALLIAAGLWQARVLLPDFGVQAQSALLPSQVSEKPTAEPAEEALAVGTPDMASGTSGESPLQGGTVLVDPTTYPTVSDLLTSYADETGTDHALEKLFRLWGATYLPGQDTACNQARKQRLDCLFQRGSWRSLVTLNLPAILSLRDDSGNDNQVVLQAMHEDYAELLLGEQPKLVSLLNLSAYWDGDFLLLWRPFSVGAPDMAPGYRGATVPALREALGRIDGNTDAPDDPMVFDEALAVRVRDFQRQHRLEPDAIVGARTQIVLSLESSDSSAPSLTSGQ
ncbi:MAG: AAA family ATPase [Gammaproteobacteria bacterium]|nr:AAA family ATPase [Gammaproteobacteria bacterium]